MVSIQCLHTKVTVFYLKCLTPVLILWGPPVLIVNILKQVMKIVGLNMKSPRPLAWGLNLTLLLGGLAEGGQNTGRPDNSDRPDEHQAPGLGVESDPTLKGSDQACFKKHKSNPERYNRKLSKSQKMKALREKRSEKISPCFW